jgi:7,8-dihydropterin-6-yl-methyl-4-(beta-D-ribofuranosyl)aminobenzene 5'-phosphate synthase
MSSTVRELRITLLADDCVGCGEGVLAEHGFAAIAEADGRSLLFDVGQSGVLIGNAQRLGIDLSAAAQVVVSHGHYDHTGALPLLLAAYGPREVIAHPAALAPKFARRRGRTPRQIGSPVGADDLLRAGAVPRLAEEGQEVQPGIFTSGPMARVTDFEAIPSAFAVRSGSGLRRDTFEDEQALIIRTRKGLVILTGCSHRGLINTVRHAMAISGEPRVHSVIGGTHLGPAGEEQIAKTVEALVGLNIPNVIATHCTGFQAAAALAAALGDAFSPGGVGCRFEL